MKHCFSLCEAAAIVLPSFGAGVISTMFLPPYFLAGCCALVFIGAGAVILFGK